MNYRSLGTTGFNVSEVSFGAWAIGGGWGSVDDDASLAALHKYIDCGGNFIDTADVYGDGRSERLVARLKSERPGDTIIVATKAGRRLNPHTAEMYTAANLAPFVERSLKNLKTDSLDILQLHTPPTGAYFQPELFEALDRLVKAGKVKHYGASIATMEEGMKALTYPNVEVIQVIFNIFRQKPLDGFLDAAKKRKVGILARIPLASGLLSGKLSATTQFAADDHRKFNRLGEHFDMGETFTGLGANLDDAFKAVDELRPLVPAGSTMAQFALKWCLMSDAVTCVIPGAKNPEQASQNCAASDLPPIDVKTMQAVREIYDRRIRAIVHSKW